MAAEGGWGTVSHFLTALRVARLLTPHVHIYRRDTENSSPPEFYFVLYCSVNYLQGRKIAPRCHMQALN